MKTIVFLAPGFEEVEALTVVDYLRRVKPITVEMVSVGDSLMVAGSHQIEVKADGAECGRDMWRFCHICYICYITFSVKGESASLSLVDLPPNYHRACESLRFARKYGTYHLLLIQERHI